MYSPSYIRQLSAEAAASAAEENRVPLVLEDADDITRSPNFGDYRPEGWELEEEYFVDSSGFGAPDEPALTLEQLEEAIAEYVGDGNYGFALTQEGQFQSYIGRFRRES